jgi:DNA-binding transcriptional regulator YdaS (Cro superfamily)
MTLHEYLRRISKADRAKLAAEVGYHENTLVNVSNGSKSCSAGLAIELERATRGVLRVEDICPAIDWSVIRGKTARPAPGASNG